MFLNLFLKSCRFCIYISILVTFDVIMVVKLVVAIQIFYNILISTSIAPDELVIDYILKLNRRQLIQISYGTVCFI